MFVRPAFVIYNVSLVGLTSAFQYVCTYLQMNIEDIFDIALLASKFS